MPHSAMKKFFKHKSASVPLILFFASCVINAALWLYTAINYTSATDIVPLHYTIYFGIDFIDFKSKLFTYPLMGLAIIIVNTALALICRQEKLIGYLLLANSVLAQILLFATQTALIIHYY